MANLCHECKQPFPQHAVTCSALVRTLGENIRKRREAGAHTAPEELDALQERLQEAADEVDPVPLFATVQLTYTEIAELMAQRLPLVTTDWPHGNLDHEVLAPWLDECDRDPLRLQALKSSRDDLDRVIELGQAWLDAHPGPGGE